ncbi:MAG: metallophosphoesterase [Anaerolineae bacterium]|nr:metallophosphoesterase [Anaerolineae bacterium]
MFSPFTFAQVSDSHVRVPNGEWHPRVIQVRDAVRARQPAVAFVLHTGDLMDDPLQASAAEFRSIFSAGAQPLYVVPGNHDVWNDVVTGEGAPWWTRATTTADEEQFRVWFGPTAYSFVYNDCAFVAFNSQLLNGALPEATAQWEWLETELARLAELALAHIILLTHMPLFVRTPDERLDWSDWRNSYLAIAPPGRDRLLALIQKHRVTGYLNGHLHYPQEHTIHWAREHSTHFVTCDASGPASNMAREHFQFKPQVRSLYCLHHVSRTKIVTVFVTAYSE